MDLRRRDLRRVPQGARVTVLHLAPRIIDCELDSDVYEARTRTSLANLRALGAPDALIAYHEGILTGIHAENARLHAALGEETTMQPDWHDIEEQAAFVPSGDGLDAARGIGWAVVLEGALLLALLGLALLVGATGHDSTGRVRTAVERAR